MDNTFQPAGDALEGINIVTCFKTSINPKFLVCGRTGVGKSSLINSLVGCEVCKVNDPGCSDGNLDPGTSNVSEMKINLDGITVTVYDTPGLQDCTDDEEKHLQEMYDKCKDVDLILYCMEMTASRYTPADVQSIQLITKTFGAEAWKRCVLVMTKANMVSVNPKEKGNEREYHKHLYETFLQKYRDQLMEQGVPKDTANAVPAIAAGLYDCREENKRYVWYVSDKSRTSNRPVDFLTELWVTCLEAVSKSSRQEFFTANTLKQLNTESEEEDYKKQLKEAEEREKETRRQLEEQARQQEINHRKQLEEEKRRLQNSRPPCPPPTPVCPPPSPKPNPVPKVATAVAVGAVVAGPVGAVIGGLLGALFS